LWKLEIKMRARKTNEPRIEEVFLINCGHGEFEFFSCAKCLEVARYRQLAVALGTFTKSQENNQMEIKWKDANEPPAEHIDKLKMLDKEKLFEYYWNNMKSSEESNDPRLLEFTRVAYEPEKFWNTIFEFGSIANALNASLYEFYERDKQLVLDNLPDETNSKKEADDEENEEDFISGADRYYDDEEEEEEDDDDDMYYDEDDAELFGEEELGEGGEFDEYLLSMLAAAAGRGGAGRPGNPFFTMNAEDGEDEDGELYDDDEVGEGNANVEKEHEGNVTELD